MWPFSKHFTLIGWDGKKHYLTAKHLSEKIAKNSNSYYSWIAPVSELANVCGRQDFPNKYAKEIKIAIINCFADLETKHELPSHHKPGDEDAVYFCYNSLTEKDSEVTNAKQKYVRAIIDGVAKYHFNLIEFNHSGPTYQRICDQWKQNCFQKFYSTEIDFHQLRIILHANFDKTMRDAEAQGVFKYDDDKRFENMNIFLSQLKRDEKREPNE